MDQQLRDILSFARGDLLVPLACASDGFEEGLAAGVAGELSPFPLRLGIL